MEDSFSGDSVLVILTNAASLQRKEFTPADFPEVPCREVIELTSYTWQIAKVKLSGGDASQLGIDDPERAQTVFDNLDLSTFKRIFQLNLKKTGKKHVLDCIRAPEVRDDLYCAEPNYTMSPHSSLPLTVQGKPLPEAVT